MADQQAWDDADLLAEWNAAKLEYQKYHSYAARGERIPAEGEESSSLEAEAITHTDSGDAPVIGPQVMPATADGQTRDESLSPEVQHEAAGSKSHHASHLPPVPEAMMRHVQDEDLKKLMMSWYYSGYYTGRYEGKQEAYAEIQGLRRTAGVSRKSQQDA